MSTLHKDAAVSTRRIGKPQMILDYNSNKGGVDCLDKLSKQAGYLPYSHESKTHNPDRQGYGLRLEIPHFLQQVMEEKLSALLMARDRHYVAWYGGLDTAAVDSPIQRAI
ncbi:hypothetical protein AAFF_G00159570 [Aldrovandia affinis]|uniref:Uncharacterized protein n=1 Tax=Aldrovandia affinis TaxID=143900 RepID=A0AAD7R0P0_9TELE|nr:hypothetical protein AAFF_G00159570 [Aldrovandia affinis]